MSSTAARRRLVRELVHTHALTSQHEMLSRLADHGHVVTQATVSRDLAAIGAVKTESGYVLDGRSSDPNLQALGRLIGEFVDTIQVGGNLVVLKTPPGAAHVVASALDQAGMDAVMGTVAGDDTLFVATESTRAAKDLKQQLETIGEGK